MKPGDIMRIIKAKDQTPWVRAEEGKLCLLIRNLGEADGVLSSPNIWEVLVDGKVMSVHKLDLWKIDEAG
jgi:archaellum component FlaG (FlaF/FlaG flagellin family)